MDLIRTLGLDAYARQLRDPGGVDGLSVSDALENTNREGGLRLIAELSPAPGAQVLEIGCGTGYLAEAIVGVAGGVSYTGLDSSLTMIEAAMERHQRRIDDGSAWFVHGRIEQAPFVDATFDGALSIGLIHFWEDAAASLGEVRRVLRPGSLMVMGCLGPDAAPPFARVEYGFFLRDANTWRELCVENGFTDVDARSARLGAPDGPELIRLAARA